MEPRGIDTFDDFELLVVVHDAMPPSCIVSTCGLVRCLREKIGVLDPGRCKTVPYHAGAQVHWQQFQEQCVRSHYCWHAAAWNRRVWNFWKAWKINCLNSSSFLKADFCVFCFTWDLTGPTPEVCGHERKFQSSFP